MATSLSIPALGDSTNAFDSALPIAKNPAHENVSQQTSRAFLGEPAHPAQKWGNLEARNVGPLAPGAGYRSPT